MKDPKVITPEQHRQDQQKELFKAEWVRKASRWKIFLARMLGTKIESFDGNYYTVGYRWKGKFYFAGGGLLRGVKEPFYKET